MYSYDNRFCLMAAIFSWFQCVEITPCVLTDVAGLMPHVWQVISYTNAWQIYTTPTSSTRWGLVKTSYTKSRAHFNINMLLCQYRKAHCWDKRLVTLFLQHRSGSTLAQLMACCLTAPSHYLNQFWLFTKDVLWQTSHESNFSGTAHVRDPLHMFKDHTFEINHVFQGLMSELHYGRSCTHYSDVIMSTISNHQPYDCLLNCLFRHRSKKTSKLCITSLCEGNSPVTGDIPSQRASSPENVSIWWHHHGLMESLFCNCPSGPPYICGSINMTISVFKSVFMKYTTYIPTACVGQISNTSQCVKSFIRLAVSYQVM